MSLNKDLFLETNPIPVKWALHRMGRIAPGIRLPLTPLDARHRPPAPDQREIRRRQCLEPPLLQAQEEAGAQCPGHVDPVAGREGPGEVVVRDGILAALTWLSGADADEISADLGGVQGKPTPLKVRLLEIRDKTGVAGGEFTTLDLSAGQRKRIALLVGLLDLIAFFFGPLSRFR